MNTQTCNDTTDTAKLRTLSAIAAEMSAERIALKLREHLLSGTAQSACGVLDKFPWENDEHE